MWGAIGEKGEEELAMEGKAGNQMWCKKKEFNNGS